MNFDRSFGSWKGKNSVKQQASRTKSDKQAASESRCPLKFVEERIPGLMINSLLAGEDNAAEPIVAYPIG